MDHPANSYKYLYGLNTIGMGTDGGGSVLGPAIGLNLYSVLLSGIGIKEEAEKIYRLY